MQSVLHNAYVWNILQAKSWLFFVKSGGGDCKIDLSGYQPMHIRDVSSPQPMFGIYFRLVLVIFLLQVGGGEKCKIYMRGCQTMHICEFSKSSAYVWNILQASPGYFLLQEGGGNVKLMCEGTNQCIFVMF